MLLVATSLDEVEIILVVLLVVATAVLDETGVIHIEDFRPVSHDSLDIGCREVITTAGTRAAARGVAGMARKNGGGRRNVWSVAVRCLVGDLSHSRHVVVVTGGLLGISLHVGGEPRDCVIQHVTRGSLLNNKGWRWPAKTTWGA